MQKYFRYENLTSISTHAPCDKKIIIRMINKLNVWNFNIQGHIYLNISF